MDFTQQRLDRRQHLRIVGVQSLGNVHALAQQLPGGKRPARALLDDPGAAHLAKQQHELLAQQRRAFGFETRQIALGRGDSRLPRDSGNRAQHRSQGESGKAGSEPVAPGPERDPGRGGVAGCRHRLHIQQRTDVVDQLRHRFVTLVRLGGRSLADDGGQRSAAGRLQFGRFEWLVAPGRIAGQHPAQQ